MQSWFWPRKQPFIFLQQSGNKTWDTVFGLKKLPYFSTVQDTPMAPTAHPYCYPKATQEACIKPRSVVAWCQSVPCAPGWDKKDCDKKEICILLAAMKQLLEHLSCFDGPSAIWCVLTPPFSIKFVFEATDCWWKRKKKKKTWNQLCWKHTQLFGRKCKNTNEYFINNCTKQQILKKNK